MNLAQTREQLRALERDDKLEKLLAPNDDGLPWADIAWMMQFPAFVGAAIHIARMATQASDSKQSPPPADLVWLAVLLLVAVVLRFGWRLLRTPAQRRRLRVRRSGLLVPAAVVQCNNAFFDEDNAHWLPASLLVSFDPKVVESPELLGKAAAAVFALKNVDRRAVPAAQAALAWDLYHEIVPTESLAVPAELSHGLKDCCLVSTLLPPKPLAVGSLFLVLAVPGDRSPDAVAAIPAAAVG